MVIVGNLALDDRGCLETIKLDRFSTRLESYQEAP